MRPTFPGMDPYLEHPAIWPDVHVRLANAIGEQLGAHVTDRYWVGIERRVYIEYEYPPSTRVLVPDLAIASTAEGGRPVVSAAAHAPVILEVADPDPVEVREVYLVLRELPSKKVVTVLEILSPANKREGAGRHEYLAKRTEVLRTRTNLVELDLLREGERLPVRGALPVADYFALIHRAIRRPKVEVFAWTVRNPLPAVPIPLLPEDGDVALDLADALRVAYDRGRYERVLEYGGPPEPPLAPVDAEWARGIVRG